MKRIWLPLVLTFILLFTGCASSETNLVLEGVVETSIFSQYSEVSGKILQFPVELGQDVKAGDIIAVIDDSNEKYALEQLQAGLLKKQAVLAELSQGTDPAEIKQGQNNVTLAQQAYESAQIIYDRTQKNYEKAESLYEAGGISESARDEAKYQADLARIDAANKKLQLDNARQKLILLEQGADVEKIASAQADIAQTESQIRQTRANLEKYKITAVTAGTIISKNYLLGDIVAPGYNLADIASAKEKYLVAYLPEDYLHSVDYGHELVIKVGEKEYKGKVAFIDTKAQYTPKDMQTEANKNKDSVKIKLRLTPDIPLKIGEKAEVLIKGAF